MWWEGQDPYVDGEVGGGGEGGGDVSSVCSSVGTDSSRAESTSLQPSGVWGGGGEGGGKGVGGYRLL